MSQKKILYQSLIAILSLIFLNACTSTLVVDGDFPSPLISKLPYSVGVHYPENFKNYTYKEASKDRQKWIIIAGDAQTELFQTVLPGMFESVSQFDTLPPYEIPPDVDMIISPTLTAFEYTLPTETSIKVYDIWLKYNIQVFSNQGSLIADYNMTAYGKTPVGGILSTNEAALNLAIVAALRDAGANLILDFAKVPEIRAWLEQH